MKSGWHGKQCYIASRVSLAPIFSPDGQVGGDRHVGRRAEAVVRGHGANGMDWTKQLPAGGAGPAGLPFSPDGDHTVDRSVGDDADRPPLVGALQVNKWALRYGAPTAGRPGGPWPTARMVRLALTGHSRRRHRAPLVGRDRSSH